MVASGVPFRPIHYDPRMAIIHQATLTPGKLGLLEAWLPVKGLERVGACRLDDPAGEVGLEIFVVRSADGTLVHAPMTYRGAPLEGADAYLIGTTDHSVLGTRWVYDAVADPVFVAVLAATIRTGGHQAQELVETPAGPSARAPLMTIEGSGSQAPGSPAEIVRVDGGDPAVVLTTVGELSVCRVLTAQPADSDLVLTGVLPGLSSPVVLAALS
jgi:hypothetical protein